MNLKLPNQSDHVANETGRILMDAIETAIKVKDPTLPSAAAIYTSAIAQIAPIIELARKGVALEEMLTKGGEVELKKKLNDLFTETADLGKPWEWMINNMMKLIFPEYSQTQETKIEHQRGTINALIEGLEEIEETHKYYLEHDKKMLKRIGTLKGLVK